MLERPGRPALPYRIRISQRAKHLRLRIDPREGVVAVCPPGLDPRRVRELLLRKADWIDRHLRALEGMRPGLGGADEHLPLQVVLPALGEAWELLYHHQPGASWRIQTQSSGQLRLRGDLQAKAAGQAALRQWLTQRARETLPTWLQRLSAETGLGFSGVVIKGQRSRWGSCSSRGNINLNRNLLFLPPPQVRYVLVHELCHTRELNHSARFWALVQRHQPDYLALRRALKEAWRLTPAWAHSPPSV